MSAVTIVAWGLNKREIKPLDPVWYSRRQPKHFQQAVRNLHPQNKRHLRTTVAGEMVRAKTRKSSPEKS